MLNKVNVSLVVALLIPVTMVIFVAISIYLPSFFLNPKYDFIYATNNGYYAPGYTVTNGHVALLPPDPYFNNNSYYNYNNSQPKLFRHKVAENVSEPISFEEAQKLNVNSDGISKDGFEIAQGSGSSGFFPFFYSGSDYGHYIKKGSFSKQINVKDAGNYYDFRFLGWIE